MSGVVSLSARRAERDATEELWLSKHDLGRALGFSTRSVDRWVAAGLPCERFGSRLRFQRSVVQAWLREQR